MTGAPAMTAEICAALAALQGAERASPRLRSACASLVGRLNAPVRIGIFGLPGAGKRALLDALCGTRLALFGPALPTLELGHGAAAQSEAVLPDGSRMASEGGLSPALLQHAPAFLTLQLPNPQLEGRRYLLLVTDAAEADIAPALAWAARRVDIALWCTSDWTPLEARLWQAAPDALRNHAIVVPTGTAIPSGLQAAREGFQACMQICLPETDGDSAEKGVQRLSDHLRKTAEAAAEQDLLAAQMFLQRHGVNVTAPEAPPGTAATVLPHPATEAPGPPVAPEAKTELARLFQYVRSSAEALRHALLDDLSGPECADDLLTRLDGIFETLSDRAGDLDHLGDAWPDLPDLLFEARDQSLLMRMEGGMEQAAEAARLLVQLRGDMEVRLAA